MKLTDSQPTGVSWDLVEKIRTLPLRRTVEHCGSQFDVSPFDVYAVCPCCGVRIKVRSFSGVAETEDAFDAVFEWMNQPGAEELAQRRRQELAEDRQE